MEAIDYWRCCDEFSIVQAVLLILNEDPAMYVGTISDYPSNMLPAGFEAVISAIKSSIESQTMSAKIVFEDTGGYGNFQSDLDVYQTKISFDEIRAWLTRKNLKSVFFDKGDDRIDDFDNRNTEFYAPKLSAAVNAWRAVTGDPASLNGKTPKQALEIWLRKHANEYGLTKEDGNPNGKGIAEISKVANWKLEGGAAKTPTQAPITKTQPPTPKPLPKNDLDEIPF